MIDMAGGVCIIAVIVSPLLGAVYEMTKSPRKPAKDYVEYSTAPSITDKWHDHALVGSCHVCGLDDAPIVHMLHGITYMPACKYCMELKNLNYHLQQNTTR